MSLPDLSELVALASRPNALMLLGVEEREISWTSFVAWLLDPARSSGLARCAVEALAEVLGGHPAARRPHEQVSEALARLAAGDLRPLWSQGEVKHRDRSGLIATAPRPP